MESIDDVQMAYKSSGVTAAAGTPPPPAGGDVLSSATMVAFRRDFSPLKMGIPLIL
jgi:hypothetical protein